jgi:putative Mg2+ transporter-C (MgtC) family protein
MPAVQDTTTALAAWVPDVDALLRLGVAALLGLALGLERELRGHAAGLRTHALLSLSAALLTVAALQLVAVIRQAGGESDPLRVVQGIAQALGFISAGLVFVARGDVRNLTTAVNLWMAASVGVVAGAGLFGLAIAATLIALLLLSVVGAMAQRVGTKQESGEHGAPAEGER